MQFNEKTALSSQVQTIIKNERVEDNGKKEKTSLLHFAIPIVPCAPSFSLSKALHWLKNKPLCLSLTASEIIWIMNKIEPASKSMITKLDDKNFCFRLIIKLISKIWV